MNSTVTAWFNHDTGRMHAVLDYRTDKDRMPVMEDGRYFDDWAQADKWALTTAPDCSTRRKCLLAHAKQEQERAEAAKAAELARYNRMPFMDET
jgi:hypothetical protein